jgi:hypothetical protein
LVGGFSIILAATLLPGTAKVHYDSKPVGIASPLMSNISMRYDFDFYITLKDFEDLREPAF